MLHECAEGAGGARVLRLTRRDVDQGKRARFHYPLSDDFFADICFAPLAEGAEAAAAAAAAAAVAASAAPSAGSFVLVPAKASAAESWEDD